MNLLGNLPEPIRDLVEFEYLSGWRQGAAKKLEWKDLDLRAWIAYLRIGNSREQRSLDVASYRQVTGNH